MGLASAVLHRDLHTVPHKVISASGLYIVLSDGRKILDATGGAAVSCIGHGNPRVLAAMASQMSELDYCHSMFFSCTSMEDLATFLSDSTGGLMPRAIITSSGSEAIESATKLARQYFTELSPPQMQRTKFIARRESYHGNTLGALGVSGHLGRRALYEPILAQSTSHVSPCNVYRGLLDGESEEGYVQRLAEELEEEFVRLGPETVCAFVAEPVVGAAAGCVPAVPGYFKAMKAVCERYGALLLLDEVMCGMGRTGTLHAWEQEGVVPDLQTIGKGLGGGYMPVAGLLIGKKVVDVLDAGTGKFMNGYTYQGHPLACRAALEVQRVVKEEKLLENCKAMGEYLEEKLKEVLGGHKNVGNIRGKGLFWALELVEDKETKKPFEAKLGMALAVHDTAMVQEPGLMLYPGTGCVDGKVGDQVLIAPPYTITRETVDEIVAGTKVALDTTVKAAMAVR